MTYLTCLTHLADGKTNTVQLSLPEMSVSPKVLTNRVTRW